MIDLGAVSWLQVEATSKCNAWCPGCSRNNNGFGLANDLVIEDLNTARFAEVVAMLPNLKVVDFCGTFGDAIAASNIIELTEIAKAASEIVVRTNGSLRNEDWWRDYAKQLSSHNHNVWFCLDGLEDTHHLYRQGTDYHKILRNAQAFIGAGGSATWQFIPWKHNEHQIKDCLKLSQELGFKQFKLVTNVRADFNARNYQNGEPYTINSWSRDQKVNTLTFVKNKVDPAGCMHLSHPSLYINANGNLNVCCFFNIHRSDSDVSKLLDIKELLANDKLVPRVCKHYCGVVEQSL